jgi:hypothetical protein
MQGGVTPAPKTGRQALPCALHYAYSAKKIWYYKVLAR